MHLNKILDQIKHHPSPTEAIDKLGKALEKHEGSLLEKGFQILKSELCANVYEAINGPLKLKDMTFSQLTPGTIYTYSRLQVLLKRVLHTV